MSQGPYFFTSYARLDNNKFTKLGDALEELRERVRGKLGEEDASEVGFFDLQDITTGQEWVDRLGSATANCRVFVCFCSNTYFNREVCGREFEAFRKRLGSTAAGARYVFPVIWDKCVLPKSIDRYQANAQGLPKEYFEDGLCSLRRLRREQEYETAIEALATGIAQAKSDPQLPLGEHPINFEALPSAFDNPDVDGVHVAVVHDNGLRWKPEIGRTARAIIEDAASTEKAGWRQFIINDQTVLNLPVGAAGSAAALMILIVPPSPVGVWKLRLEMVDKELVAGGNRMVAVLAGATRGPGGNATQSRTEDNALIRALLPGSGASGTHNAVFDAGSAKFLEDLLRITISRLRMDRLAASQTARVSSPQLEASARDAGIPIDSRPTLSGPGGKS